MSKFVGKGASISMTVGTTVTTPAQIVSITPPQGSAREAESTTLDSTVEEHLFALVVPGTGSLVLGFDPANATHTDWQSKYEAGTTGTFIVTLGTTVTYTGKRLGTFTGYLTAFTMTDITIDGMNTANVGIRSNSVIAWSS